MIEKLKNTERILVGAWIFENGKNVDDSVSKRIQCFIAEILKKVTLSDDGWDRLYIDMEDFRYWGLTYPDGHLHGGGSAVKKYFI